MLKFWRLFVAATISFGTSAAYGQQNNSVKPLGQTRTSNQEPIGADRKAVGPGIQNQGQINQSKQPTPLTDAQRADRAKYLSPEENAFHIRKEIADEKFRRAQELRNGTGVNNNQSQINQSKQPIPLTDAQRADRAKYLSPEENAFHIRKEIADEKFRRNTCIARGGTNC